MGNAVTPPAFGLKFDGVDDRVTFGRTLATGTATFTVEAWFMREGPGKTASTGTGGLVAVPLVTKGAAEADGSNLDANYFLGIDGATQVLAADFEDTATGLNHPVLGTTRLWPSVWYHAAATYDGTTWRLYLNGNLEKTLVVGSFTPRFDSIQHAGLGAAFTSAGVASGAFQGQLDEARIWNVARSQADIAAAISGPLTSGTGLLGRFGLDEGTGLVAINSVVTVPAVNGTLAPTTGPPTWVAGGSPFVPSPSPGTYGLHLGGTPATNDYVSMGAAPGLNAATFTIETWFKKDGVGVATSTGTGGITAAVPLVTKGRAEGEASNVDMNYFLGLNGNFLAADFEEGVSAGGTPGLNHPLTGVIPIVSNVWTHAAVTYDGNTLALYVNGAFDSAIIVGRPPRSDSIQWAGLGTAFTSTGASAGLFAGTLDEARIWNYARTPAQILNGKDREIPSASGLLGRWSFNAFGPTFVEQDSSGNNQTGTINGTGWTLVNPGASFSVASVNAAPVVNAGPDQLTTVGSPILLAGAVTDDGVTGMPVTTGWSKTSGPGTVSFFNANAANTTATFSAAGTYVLTLTGNDGELSGTDQVSVQVNGAVGVNQAPTANAGPDQAITFPSQALLTGSYTDDGLPGVDVNSAWSQVSGPGTVTFAQPLELNTTASFSAAGTYVLMLTANDGALSGNDTVTITVTTPSAGSAIDFGGTNAYVTFGPAPGLGASTFTLEAWIRRDGAGAATSTGTGGVNAVPIVTKGRAENDGSNVDMNYFLGLNATGTLAADFEDTATGLNHPVSGVATIAIGAWHHVAATYDGTTWRLYVDGTLDQALVVGSFTPRFDSIQHAGIGSALTSAGAAAGFFDGAIDEVRIWSGARTQQQIADGRTTEIVSAANLLGRWGLNENAGSTVADTSGHSINGTILPATAANYTWTPGVSFTGFSNHPPDAPVLNVPGNAGTGVHSPATLSVKVSDQDSDAMNVTFYGRQKPTTAPDFTLATLPDTQFYSQTTTFWSTFTAQTNWIVANRAPMNIAFVSHLGDVTQDADQFEAEWQRADTSMGVLDASGIPYGMSPGNHDESGAGVATFYDKYFPVSRFLRPDKPGTSAIWDRRSATRSTGRTRTTTSCSRWAARFPGHPH